MLSSGKEEAIRRARRIGLVVLDVDGVLTDGELAYGPEGEALKRFHVHDGLGIQLLRRAGIEVAIVSARGSQALDRRVHELGIDHYYPHSSDKLGRVSMLAAQLGLQLDRVCFAGDDVLDLPVMRAVGLAVAVASAHRLAKEAAHLCTEREGGRGAVRELADFLLEARGGLAAVCEQLLSATQPAPAGRRLGATEFGVIIPARYGARRLPGKPLLQLAGKPMVVHVLDRARRAGAAFVVVATDDERIARVVAQAGGEVMMTQAHHPSGTDRLAEVAERMGLDDDAVVVNLQGDEPLIEPVLIQRVARVLFQQPGAPVATVATPIRKIGDVLDPSVVKVIVNHAGLAVTFSRAPIPWIRDVFQGGQPPEVLPDWPTFLRHLGMYAYRVGALREITAHPAVPLEQAEALEQLRMLWLGIPIHVTVVDEAPAHGVDTEADVAAAERLLARVRGAPPPSGSGPPSSRRPRSLGDDPSPSPETL